MNNLNLLHQQYHSMFPENRFDAHKRYLMCFDLNIDVSPYSSDVDERHPELIFIHIPKNGGSTYDYYFKRIYKQKIPHNMYMIDNFFYNSWEHNIEYFNFPLLNNWKIIPKHWKMGGTNRWDIIPEHAISGIMYKNKAYFDKYATAYSHIHLCLYNASTNSDVIIDNIDYYVKQSSKIFIMLREPINRIISEYNFLMKYAKKNPFDITNQYIIETMLKYDSFKSYIYHSNCHNYQLGFIYGGKWKTNFSLTPEKIDYIKKIITDKKIYVGILEYPEHNKRLCHHLVSTRYNHKVKLLKMNKTPENNYSLNVSRKDISDKDIEYLYKKNKEDYEIYNFALQHLTQNYKVTAESKM